MLSYKKQKEALLKEAQQYREVVKEGISPVLDAGRSKGKKVLLVAGGAALAYGLANWYLKKNNNTTTEQSEEIENTEQSSFSFMDTMKEELAKMASTFIKEQLNNLLQRKKGEE